MTKPRSLQWWLDKYSQIQEDILLLYRPTPEDFWNDRCLYLADNYSPHKAYNHRAILETEVVIEYDEKDKNKNLEYANTVCKRLAGNNIEHALWWSGNKSYHVHCIIDIKKATSPTALKRAFVRAIGVIEEGDKKVFPDLQLCSENHLIRAENGVHEKTRKKKTLLKTTRNYPEASDVPIEVWEAYHAEMRRPRPARSSKEIRAHPGFEYILSSHRFQETGDGHSRALFILIHALKEDYANKEDEFIAYLQDWYRYSGGKSLSPSQIAHKVKYETERTYVISARMIDELMESLGKPELTSKPPAE